jgi:hypothetical protein
MKWLLTVLFASCCTAYADHGTSCPPLDRAQLQRLFTASLSSPLQLIFFSSWCSDCASHLKQLTTDEHKDKILVGTFDKQPRIEKVVSRLGLKQKCFTDSGLGKILKVSTVPTERILTIEVFKQIDTRPSQSNF